MNVVNTAAKACQDSDKVKANGVRSLGNVLRYIPAKSVGKLVVKAKVVKVKANGIRSLDNILRCIPAKSVDKLVVKFL